MFESHLVGVVSFNSNILSCLKVVSFELKDMDNELTATLILMFQYYFPCFYSFDFFLVCLFV